MSKYSKSIAGILQCKKKEKEKICVCGGGGGGGAGRCEPRIECIVQLNTNRVRGQGGIEGIV